MRWAAVLWVLLVGGWLVVVGGGLFALIIPTYESIVAGVVADRVLAETASTLESAPHDIAMTDELSVPETLGGTPYHVGIDDGQVYLEASGQDIDRAVPLEDHRTVTYADSACQSNGDVQVVVTPADNTTIVSLCGGE